MPTSKYIVLTNSNASISKRFKATAMQVPLEPTDTLEMTLDGSPDLQTGPIVRSFRYILRVPLDEQVDQDYGNWDDLEALFALRNPWAVPSNVIELTDHFGNVHDCYFVGGASPEPLTTMLEGVSAYYMVQIQLREIEYVAPTSSGS